MLLRSLKCASLAASALAAVALVTPAIAQTPEANLGPVGPYEPILAMIGDKRVIAYYAPDGGKCTVSAVVFDASPGGGGLGSTRVRVSLSPGETFNLDAVKDETVSLACGDGAGKLVIVNRREVKRSASKAAD
ncbi:MAG: hypothetical protein ACRECX_11330 [Methyloceanibacter sp.]|uniref:hypothetical protein n=1 Tax=Methyloceanibacter sp. TaxID=1965321 RepID=UPI003D6CC341